MTYPFLKLRNNSVPKKRENFLRSILDVSRNTPVTKEHTRLLLRVVDVSTPGVLLGGERQF